jgi:hypothetical protein
LPIVANLTIRRTPPFLLWLMGEPLLLFFFISMLF